MCYKVIIIGILGTAWALWIFINENKKGNGNNETTLELMDINITETILI